MKKLLSLPFLLVLTFSGSLLAHNGHPHSHGGLWGTAGVVFNTVEAGKHAVVVYDQLTGPSDERSYPVLLGNAMIFLAHMFYAHQHVQDKNHARHVMTIPIFLAANAMTILDLFVDGVTTWEYWTKDSFVAFVNNLVAPVCTGHNLWDLYLSLQAARKA